MLNTQQFAAAVRAVDGAASRRTSLGAALAAGFAALLSRFAADDAAGRKKRRKKKKCKGGTTKCGKTCFDLATNGANCGACGNACLTGECVHGACICATSEDCADGCFCKKSAQGAFACASAPTEDPCETDDDCPLGSYCLISNGETCSVPCQG